MAGSIAPRSVPEDRDPTRRKAVTKDELNKIERYLRRSLGSPTITVKARPRKTDSAEVYVGEEFIGVVFEDDEDDEKSYNFQMAILGMDLED
nr:DUF3126 family protein [Oharaeibacter diazotrophicus]